MRKKLYVPRVEDKNSFMRMLNISRMDDLIANSMDILEPASCDAEGNEREDGLYNSSFYLHDEAVLTARVFCFIGYLLSFALGKLQQF